MRHQEILWEVAASQRAAIRAAINIIEGEDLYGLHGLSGSVMLGSTREESIRIEERLCSLRDRLRAKEGVA